MSPIYRRLMILGSVVLLAACELGDDSTPDGIAEVTALSPEDHDAKFPIVEGEHGGMDCNSCHGEFDSFSQFTCISCHDHPETETRDKHTGVSNYQYASEACYNCHPRGVGELDRASHEVYFPISAPKPHQEVACSSCHLVPDRKVVACFPCHAHEEAEMGTKHTGIDGYAYTSDKCLACHPRGEVDYDRPSHGVYFPIASGSAHQDTACSECHRDPNDRTVVTCAGCHGHESGAMTSAHAISDYAFQDAACLRCHAEAQVDRISMHRPFNISSGDHRASRRGCLKCHNEARADKPWAQNFTKFGCLLSGCHDAAETRQKHLEEIGSRYSSDPVRCVSAGCHPDGSEGD